MTEFHPNGAAPLDHLGVIRVAGTDARSFLQGQLTQDFALLEPDQARLAAFLSAKGRMQASFVGFAPAADEVLLVCSRDLLEATRKRLSMFVLRAKAVLTDATGDYLLRGLLGGAITTIAGGALPEYARTVIDSHSVIGLPPAGDVARAFWIAPAGSAEPELPVLDTADWLRAEVMSGVATLSAPLIDLFVPQMLNFESVGGVNFKKGCYPGQEVVARSQFRGTLKRRAFIVQADAPLDVGAEVFHASDDSQPCGTIVEVAPIHKGSFAIASLQIAATQAGMLRAGHPGGTVLEILPLPYPLLDDI
jgi:folate-binding protein YgfZ